MCRLLSLINPELFLSVSIIRAAAVISAKEELGLLVFFNKLLLLLITKNPPVHLSVIATSMSMERHRLN